MLKPNSLITAAITFAACYSPLLAQTDWGHSFQASSPSLPDFETGVLLPFKLTAIDGPDLGYAFEGASSRPDPENSGERFGVGYLSRFDASGLSLWNVALDLNASTTALDLVAVPEDEDVFFASYDEPIGLTDKAFRLGLLQGASGTPVFAKRFVTNALTPHYVEYFTGEKMGVTLDLGTTIESVVFDETGSSIFNKAYSSPLFSGVSPFVIQTLARDILPDESGYLTAVAQSISVFDGVGSFTNEVTLIPFATDLTGEVTSSNSFNFSVGSPGTVPLASLLSDNSVLYRIPSRSGEVTIGGNADPVTHLVKVNADGSLAWSKTISSGLVLSVFPTPDAIYLAGSRPTPGNPSPGLTDALVLKVDLDTGALLNQAAFTSISALDIASSVATNDTHVFVNIYSLASTNEGRPERTGISTVVKLDQNLAVVDARQFLEKHDFSLLTPDDPIDDISRFLLSIPQASNGTIRAFTLDDKLDTALNCKVLTAFTPTLTSGVTLNNLSVTTAPANVTAANAQTAFTDSTITVTSYAPSVQEICSISKGLTIKLGGGGTEVILSFPTEIGTTYSLGFSPDLTTPFTPVDSVKGTGNNETFSRPIGDGKGFYSVSPPPPGN